MYKSPIKIDFSEPIYERLQKEADELVVKAVQDVHISVDREDLIKALEYDRNQYEKGAWDMFEMITSAWFGKQYYFLQDDGTVYGRYNGKTLPNKDEAYKEFLAQIGDE